MKFLLAAFILLFVSSCGQSPERPAVLAKKITRNFQPDINLIIPSGEIIVNIMDEVIMSPRRQELQAKFIRGIQENAEWYLQQQKIAETSGSPVPYNSKIGLTESEWEEYKIFIDDLSDIKAVSTGIQKIVVTKKDNRISFKGDGKLAFLNDLIIDTKSQAVKLFEFNLTSMDTICVTDPRNAFNSSWRGYKWQFSSLGNKPFPSSKEELAGISGKLYTLTLGLLSSTGETLLKISGAEIQNGVKSVSYEIPIIF